MFESLPKKGEITVKLCKAWKATDQKWNCISKLLTKTKNSNERNRVRSQKFSICATIETTMKLWIQYWIYSSVWDMLFSILKVVLLFQSEFLWYFSVCYTIDRNSNK